MSSLFGGGGGSKGFTDPTTVDIPPFESAGGVTPQQQDLGEYSYGQDLLGERALFGGTNTGESTMATQGAGGAAMTKAQQLGQRSDIDQEAQYNLYQNDIQGLEANLKTQTDLNQIQTSAADQSLASLANQLFGAAGKTGGATTTGASS